MQAELPVGTRVRVLSDPEFGPGPWPAQPTGRISGSPTAVDTVSGPMLTYWVTFDEPQRDADGDGPYSSSQILSKYLQIIEV